MRGIGEGFSSAADLSCHFAKDKMRIREPNRVFQARANVLVTQGRVFAEDVVPGITGGQKFQNRLHRDSRPRNDGLAIADVRVDGYSIHCRKVIHRAGMRNVEIQSPAHR